MSTVVVGTVQSNSTSPPTFKNTSGTEIGTLCRAFVNFNGTGTVAIRASFNVSSITDNGTGNYTVNFTTALPDANYSTVASTISSNGSNTGVLIADIGTYSTTSVQIFTSSGFVSGVYSATAFDVSTACVAIFR